MSASAALFVGAICLLESLPEGVLARGCTAGEEWTIAAPPVAMVMKGRPGGQFRGRTVDIQLSDGDSAWLAVSEPAPEGSRPLGLVRHDWKRDVTHPFRGSDAGPCGFDVHDLMLRGDILWVATDLGVSRLRLSREDWDEWAHYTRAADGRKLEETACASVLSTVAEAASEPGGDALAARLAEFRPRFWKRHQRRAAAARRSAGTRPASPPRRRTNEQTLGNARGAGAGRGADVHPRPLRRPKEA
jgi:hypothetical protein